MVRVCGRVAASVDSLPGFPQNTASFLEGFPSGQRDQTVNLTAQPSEVRILPPPPESGISLCPAREGGGETAQGHVQAAQQQLGRQLRRDITEEAGLQSLGDHAPDEGNRVLFAQQPDRHRFR